MLPLRLKRTVIPIRISPYFSTFLIAQMMRTQTHLDNTGKQALILFNSFIILLFILPFIALPTSTRPTHSPLSFVNKHTLLVDILLRLLSKYNYP